MKTYNQIDLGQIKFVVYIRKSSEGDERQALSPENQRKVIEQIVERYEIKPKQIVKTFDEAHSAKTPGQRPMFNKLLQGVEEGIYDGILTWQPSRMSRNPIDAGSIVNLMDTEKLKVIITAEKLYEHSIPMDKFWFGFQCMEAKLENDNRAISSKGGMVTKAEMGWYPAPAPIGFINVTTEKKGFKTIADDNDRWLICKKCFDFILDGMKPFEVMAKAQKEWKLTNIHGGIISNSGFYHMINNPFYCGEFEWPKKSGVWYKGKHNAVISRANFRIIQKMLGNKGAPIKRCVTYKYGGLMRCSECGYGFSGDYKEKYYPMTKNTGTYFYYRCTKKSKKIKCHQAPISEGTFEKQIDDLLLSIRPPQGFLDWAKRWVAELHKYNANFHQDVRQSLHDRKEKIEKRLDSFMDMKADHEITQEKYLEKKLKAEDELKDIDDAIKTNDEGSSNWRAKVENALDFADAAHERFMNSKDASVKRYLVTHLGENLVCHNKNIRMDLEKHFLEFNEQGKWDEKYKGWREPQEYTEIMAKYPDLRPSNPVWLPLEDSDLGPIAYK